MRALRLCSQPSQQQHLTTELVVPRNHKALCCQCQLLQRALMQP
jgi:hypothetical protein